MTTERNAPCPCGSGQKYKHCCGQFAAAAPPAKDGGQAPLLALFAARRYAELEQAAQALIASGGDAGFTWKALGVALKMQGKDAREALRRAAELLPDDAEAHFNLANALKDAGETEQAIAHYERALALRPGFALAHNNLGLALHALGRFDVAIAHFEQALASDASLAGAHLNTGNALMELGAFEGAAANFRRALQIDAKLATAQRALGLALRKAGRADEAMASARAALDINPQSADAWVVLAELLSDQGQFAQAQEAYQRAIAIDEACAHAWAALARLRRMTVGDQDWLTAVQRLVATPLPARQEAALRFALGKYFDDTHDHAQAFAHYRTANELAKSCSKHYEREQQTRLTNKLIEVFDRAWFAQARASNPSARPLLVVGMPRSGTSLVEQILAAHPAVFGAGELPFWGHALTRHHAAALLGEHGPRILHDLADEYLHLLRGFSADAERVVDKMPANFMRLGLIHSAFPQARIIHVQRDPADTGLSIYFQNFEAANAYANDLDDIAHYTREYRRLMRHWHATLAPGALLEVRYEDLVADPESQARNMLDFAGLPWDARCLEFHDHRRVVNTASSWQVRQKISKGAIGRWRHYRQFIAPLLALQAKGA